MRVLIGLGGNVGDPPAAFRRALGTLADEQRLLAMSRLYRTAPVGPEQPPFLNLAAVVEVSVDVRRLLVRGHELEAAAGRNRATEARWGPRPLDVDLLLADGVVCRGPRLELPHPRLAQRAFALVPAAEVAPEWVHPLLGRRVADLAEEVLARDPAAVELVGPLLR